MPRFTPEFTMLFLTPGLGALVTTAALYLSAGWV